MRAAKEILRFQRYTPVKDVNTVTKNAWRMADITMRKILLNLKNKIMELNTLVGLVMVYAWVHTIVLFAQKKTYKEMKGYEQTVVIVAITGVVLTLVGLMM